MNKKPTMLEVIEIVAEAVPRLRPLNQAEGMAFGGASSQAVIAYAGELLEWAVILDETEEGQMVQLLSTTDDGDQLTFMLSLTEL